MSNSVNSLNRGPSAQGSINNAHQQEAELNAAEAQGNVENLRAKIGNQLKQNKLSDEMEAAAAIAKMRDKISF